MIRPLLFAGAAALAVLNGSSAGAKPDMQLPAPETVADRGAPGYSFESLRIVSADGERAYRLRVGIPLGPPPPQGYAALWMLDGNAALAYVDEALLAELAETGPPVIVAIGHDSPLRLDGVERVRDYTPGAGSQDAFGRKGGGADAFLDLIEMQMKPAVAALAPLNPGAQAVWGHSLGGLFVLHTLLERPGAFDLYFATSPALWWNEREILGALGDAPPRLEPCRCTVIVARGSVGSPKQGRTPIRPQDAVSREDEDAFLAELARFPGLALRRIDYPGLSHGETMEVSIPDALRAAAALPPGKE